MTELFYEDSKRLKVAIFAKSILIKSIYLRLSSKYASDKTNKTLLNFSANNISANTYLFKFINRNARKRGETCSEVTIKTPERRQDVALGFLLSTLNVFLLLTLQK